MYYTDVSDNLIIESVSDNDSQEQNDFSESISENVSVSENNIVNTLPFLITSDEIGSSDSVSNNYFFTVSSCAVSDNALYNIEVQNSFVIFLLSMLFAFLFVVFGIKLRR